MRGSSWLAIAVCTACFLIGYLTYVAADLVVDFFIERAAPCQFTGQACAQQETPQKDR
jgi:hypothetical protein